MAYIEQDVRKLVGKAIHHYDLIHPEDRIAVAVSGGKDSLLLLWLLRERLRHVPIRYYLVAVHVDMGFQPGTAEILEAFFRAEGFDYRILRTDYGLQAHSSKNKENPCFLCARRRRAALFREAQSLGCSKLALAHNQDDFIETFFINILYGAQTAAIVPRQSFFQGAIEVIRPLVLVDSQKVDRMVRRLGLPTLKNPCPSAQRNARSQIREFLFKLYRSNRKIRGNIFHAMSHVNLEYLPPPLLQTRGSVRKVGKDTAVEREGYPEKRGQL
ncbi:MAG: tRNA lysidine(34) synthetase [Desulfosoma sp.]|uniref:tRNA lysidine(34) synthetase n=1 Tax=Desulfosoma sp. TaxID=2603217 RepID=UPI00404ACAB2